MFYNMPGDVHGITSQIALFLFGMLWGSENAGQHEQLPSASATELKLIILYLSQTTSRTSWLSVTVSRKRQAANVPCFQQIIDEWGGRGGSLRFQKCAENGKDTRERKRERDVVNFHFHPWKFFFFLFFVSFGMRSLYEIPRSIFVSHFAQTVNISWCKNISSFYMCKLIFKQSLRDSMFVFLNFVPVWVCVTYIYCTHLHLLCMYVFYTYVSVCACVCESVWHMSLRTLQWQHSRLLRCWTWPLTPSDSWFSWLHIGDPIRKKKNKTKKPATKSSRHSCDPQTSGRNSKL